MLCHDLCNTAFIAPQGAIQANHPVSVNCTVFYYELTVLDGGISGKIAIGFADKNFKLTRQPG